MQTKACPACSEVIPVDVDYCPFCGESTHESMMTDEDVAQAEAAQRKRESQPDPYHAPAPAVPPRAGVSMCMMCYDEPATDGDYCADCKAKLDLRPEQWDIKKSEDLRRSAIIGWAVAVIVLVLILTLLLPFLRHSHHLNTAIPTGKHASVPSLRTGNVRTQQFA